MTVYIVHKKIVTVEKYIVNADSELEAKQKLSFNDIPLEVNTKEVVYKIGKQLDDDEYMDYLRDKCPEDWSNSMIKAMIID